MTPAPGEAAFLRSRVGGRVRPGTSKTAFTSSRNKESPLLFTSVEGRCIPGVLKGRLQRPSAHPGTRLFPACAPRCSDGERTRAMLTGRGEGWPRAQRSPSPRLPRTSGALAALSPGRRAGVGLADLAFALEGAANAKTPGGRSRNLRSDGGAR
jgi:hypothetical protein